MSARVKADIIRVSGLLYSKMDMPAADASAKGGLGLRVRNLRAPGKSLIGPVRHISLS
jgi:hypothetical protein